MSRVGSAFEMQHIATPGRSPVAGHSLLYVKTDGKAYLKSVSGESGIAMLTDLVGYSPVGHNHDDRYGTLVGGNTWTGLNVFQNSVGLYDHSLYLRTIGDVHRLHWSSTVDGPRLIGYTGGELATGQEGELWQAHWNYAGTFTSRRRLVAGDGTGSAEIISNAQSGSPNYWNMQREGVSSWMMYDAGDLTSLYFRDMTNARMHMSFHKGAADNTAQTYMNSNLTVFGDLNESGNRVWSNGHTSQADGRYIRQNTGGDQIIRRDSVAGNPVLELFNDSGPISLQFHNGSDYYGRIKYDAAGFSFRQGDDGSYVNITAAAVHAQLYDSGVRVYSAVNPPPAAIPAAHTHHDLYYTESESDARYPTYGSDNYLSGKLAVPAGIYFDGWSADVVNTATQTGGDANGLVPQYGIGRFGYNDGSTGVHGSNTAISGYFGIEMFTGGTSRFRIDAASGTVRMKNHVYSGKTRAGLTYTIATYGVPLSRNVSEYELTAQSMVTIGETAVGSANPSVTWHRTDAGYRVGSAYRQRYESGVLWFDSSPTGLAYGSEVWTNDFNIQNNGNVVARSGLYESAGAVRVWSNNYTGDADARYVGISSTQSISGQKTFTGGNGSTDAWASAPVTVTTTNPTILFHWPSVVANSLSMNSAGELRWTDPYQNTYYGFRAGAIYDYDSRVWSGNNMAPADARYGRLGANNTWNFGQTIDGGGPALTLKPGTADHVYINFFADSQAPNTRSGYLGFGGPGSNVFYFHNDLGGNFIFNGGGGLYGNGGVYDTGNRVYSAANSPAFGNITGSLNPATQIPYMNPMSTARKDAVINLNTGPEATQNGFWCAAPGSTNTPEGAAASGSWWFGWTIHHDPSQSNLWVTQFAQQMTGPSNPDSSLYFRRCQGGTWGTWQVWALSRTEMDARYAAIGHTHTGYAPTASPTFTGSVVVPTATSGTQAVNKSQMETAITAMAAVGQELRYAEITTEVNKTGTAVYNNTSAGLVTGLSVPTIVGTGRPVEIEVWAIDIANSSGNNTTVVYLMDGATGLTFGKFQAHANGEGVTGSVKHRMVLTNGVSYNFKVGISSLYGPATCGIGDGKAFISVTQR